MKRADCPTCHGVGVVPCDAGHMVAMPCQECECETCGGTRYLFEDDSWGGIISKPCPDCSSMLKKCTMLNRSRLTHRHRACSFDGYRKFTKEQEHAVDWFRARMETWEPGDKAALLHGDVGTGKTHLLSALIRFLVFRREIQSRYVWFGDLLATIRRGYDKGESESAIIGPLLDVPVLIIDEIGRNMRTDWQRAILDRLITMRYDGKRSTFYATNYPIDLPAGSTIGRSSSRDDYKYKTLGDVIGSRLVSRLRETCDFIEVSGPCYRTMKAEERAAGGAA